MKCSKCKAPLRRGARFCPKCGTQVKYMAGNILLIVPVVVLLLGGIGAAVWNLGLFQITSSDEQLSQTKKAEISLLAYAPFEDHKDQLALSEYEVSGGIRESNGKYSTYTNLPDLPVIAALVGDFGHNGAVAELIVSKQDAKGGGDDHIAIKFEFFNGGSHTYELNVGKDWNGESVYCYLCYGKDSDYLVLESLSPVSSNVGTDTYYIGRADGNRTEEIRIIRLNDFSEIKYTLSYNIGSAAFTIDEYITPAEGSSSSQCLYNQDGVNYGYAYDGLYKSYDEAIAYIKEQLSLCGLSNRVGTATANNVVADIVPLFIEYRSGIQQDIPLASISDIELQDTMTLGMNSELVGEDTNSAIEAGGQTGSLLGIWDSDDGKMRLIFSSTGLDYSITYENGIANADGSMIMVDLKRGEKKNGGYTISGDQIALMYDLNSQSLDFSLSNKVLTIDGKTFHSVAESLANQLVGTWEGDERRIIFDENCNATFYDTSRNRRSTGIYAVLNESEVLVSVDESPMSTVIYSVNGNCLTFGDVVLYRDGADASYETVSSVEQALIGSWESTNGAITSYYVFNSDGTYEYYAVDSLYKVGQPTLEGIYKVISAGEIRVYYDFYETFYQEVQYANGALLDSSGIQYAKVK